MFLELLDSSSDEKFWGIKLSGEILMLVQAKFIHIEMP